MTDKYYVVSVVSPLVQRPSAQKSSVDLALQFRSIALPHYRFPAAVSHGTYDIENLAHGISYKLSTLLSAKLPKLSVKYTLCSSVQILLTFCLVLSDVVLHYLVLYLTCAVIHINFSVLLAETSMYTCQHHNHSGDHHAVTLTSVSCSTNHTNIGNVLRLVKYSY